MTKTPATKSLQPPTSLCVCLVRVRSPESVQFTVPKVLAVGREWSVVDGEFITGKRLTTTEKSLVRSPIARLLISVRADSGMLPKSQLLTRLVKRCWQCFWEQEITKEDRPPAPSPPRQFYLRWTLTRPASKRQRHLPFDLSRPPN